MADKDTRKNYEKEKRKKEKREKYKKEIGFFPQPVSGSPM
jgi:hypothetical protein